MNRHPSVALLARALFVSVLLTLGLVAHSPAQVTLTPSAQVDHALKFILSQDASGTLDAQQVRQCFSLAMQLLKLPDNNMPRVLVIHASPEVARVADVQTTTVRYISRDERTYYEFWILGQPHMVDYLRGIYTIFEKHYRIQISNQDRMKTSQFVLRYLTSTVNAHKEKEQGGFR